MAAAVEWGECLPRCVGAGVYGGGLGAHYHGGVGCGGGVGVWLGRSSGEKVVLGN
jgi:hypothetical protein